MLKKKCSLMCIGTAGGINSSVIWIMFTFKPQNQIIQDATSIDISSFKIFLWFLFQIHISIYFKNSHTCKLSSENFLNVYSIQYLSVETRTKLHWFLFVLNFYASDWMLQNTLHTNESIPNRNQKFCQSKGRVKGKAFKCVGYPPLNYIISGCRMWE